MSITIDRAPELARRDVPAKSSRATLVKVLLACGVLYSVLYAVVNDVIAASRYEGYSRMSQAVSELSATGAPTKALLTAMLPIFSVVPIAFGIGVWMSARGKRALRVTGGLLVANGALAPLWLLAPMSQREVIAAGGATSSDTIDPPRPQRGDGPVHRLGARVRSRGLREAFPPLLARFDRGDPCVRCSDGHTDIQD